MSDRSVGVVGGGIVGLAIARELTTRFPGIEITVFEKEASLGFHQTGHNSGVLHAGIYYKPGSLKAKLCTTGRAMMEEFCIDSGLPIERCGKLVVAIDKSELQRFDALEKTAAENNVPGLTRVAGQGITDIEPNAAGLVALHSPATAIADYVAVAEAMGDDIKSAGGTVLLSTEVVGIATSAFGVAVTTGNGNFTFDNLVMCGGVQADRLAALSGDDEGPRILPFRGEYMSVVESKQDLVRGMIYPVPDPRYPFLGVHFTRRVTGGLEVGPNALLALDREGYQRSNMNLGDIASIVTWPGFWRMAQTHWKTGAAELLGSMSIKQYMKAASRYVPTITHDDVERAGAGIRAQAVERDGSLVDDFRISNNDGIVSVRNAPSPAATSSLAIAQYVVDHMKLAG